jgi:hypothetical protein
MTNDTTSSEVYLKARHTWVRSAKAAAPANRVAVNHIVATLAHECPSVMAGSPRGHDYDELNIEAVLTLIYADKSKQMVGATLDFVRRIERIHWSDRRLDRLVRALRIEEEAKIKLVPPNLCTVMAAWVASGYLRLPSEMVRFLQEVEQVSRLVARERDGEVIPRESGGGMVWERFRQIGSRDEQRAVDHIERDEAVAEGAVDQADAAGFLRLQDALGLEGA